MLNINSCDYLKLTTYGTCYIIITININNCLFKCIYTFPSDVEVSREIENGDNSTSDHTVEVDPDQLFGPQGIDMIMNKPGMRRWFKLCYLLLCFSIEFSFLIKYYSLLYQSLIPNCNLTLNTLHQHISISDNIEQYIVSAASHRTSCQRIINFLLTRLYSKMDYMQFCYHLNIISVMTDLPYRLIAGTLLLYLTVCTFCTTSTICELLYFMLMMYTYTRSKK